MANRKLGRPSDQRKALLRNQVTNLIWYGKIETTLERAKEVRSIAEHIIKPIGVRQERANRTRSLRVIGILVR